MSGIVGIINLDGAPIDPKLLRRMTDSMTFRGPDAQEVWVDGNVGFGHTMLRTTWEAETEKQPLTLDGRVWLTADARIDGRAELISELEIKLRTKLRIPERSNANGSYSRTPNDAELILHAYHAWGEDCVKHLIGDFAFAIWDGRGRRLFCARDQFGVKPFYYARVADCFVFSNTLNCVRLHPAVSAKLNDVAIGDFLLWGENQEPATTAFADIARLPGAHSLMISQAGLSVRRYWSLPADFHLNYKDSRDYPEQFRALLSQSVADRLRTDRVALEVSGGLDSTSVAATAKQLMANRPDDAMKGFCVSYERLIPDQEKRYADIAAAAIGLPIEHIIGDDSPLFEEDVPKPEPFNVYPLSAISTEVLKRMAAHSRVALTGWDGDTWMHETPRHYFRFLLKRGQLGRLASAMSWYVKSQRKPPPVGVRTMLMRLRGKYPVRPPYPVWLEPEFEARAGLRERWEEVNAEPALAHPTRPRAFDVLSSPSWASLFESYDAGVTGLPMEARHPVTDLRVVEFLLRLPPVPWCVNKQIVRAAMRDKLPPEIVRRPKTPLAGDPAIGIAGKGVAASDRFEPHSMLMPYIEQTALRGISRENDTWALWMNSRPLGLSLWLKSRYC
jgi:asparagine synthase (glutamine-hydrolysing)